MIIHRPQFHPSRDFKESYQEELTIFKTDSGRLWLFIGLLLLFGIIPFIAKPGMFRLLNMIGIFAIASLGLNLLSGYTGKISLMHGAFFGTGAYTAVFLTTDAGLPFYLAVPAAGITTALVGIGFGLTSARLKVVYFCIATLAGQLIIEYLFVLWANLSDGAEYGINFAENRSFYYMIYIYLAIMAWLMINLVRSKFGRTFIAIRDNERTAEGIGIPIFRYNLLSFAISSLYAGIAGGLYAFWDAHFSPGDFNLWLSIEFIAIVLIGGLGSVSGPIIGAIVIVIFSEILKHAAPYLMVIGGTTDINITVRSLHEFSIGLAVVLFVVLQPKGLADVWRIIQSKLKSWPFSHNG